MEDFVKTVIFFCLIEWISNSPITKSETVPDEFYAIDTVRKKKKK